MTNLEEHFQKFRKNIIGIDHTFKTNGDDKKIIYADWIASGRLYGPIERYLTDTLGPFVANTHTETTVTGTTMTDAYHQAQVIIKEHVNAGPDDVLISAGYGMTAVVNKFQRILGLKVPEKLKSTISHEDKPLVIITHMEHHSNQTSWLECFCDLEIINPDVNGLPDLKHLRTILENNSDRSRIIASISASSNVTGVFTPVHEIAEIVHEFNGFCFADYAASAPYSKIDMHPPKRGQHLDAIFFSPHKFLGGPGSSGILIFNKSLYENSIPDHPGGGTVKWTNPWGGHSYFDDIEAREDGGTPGFLQTIKASLAILLKEEMGIENIKKREEELIHIAMDILTKNPKIHILEKNNLNRLSVFSFYIENIHYNLFVKLLNDVYGIQTRGGCSCAGTYGHILLHVDEATSQNITKQIDSGDLTSKPGWVRLSLHPTMTDEEATFICQSILDLSYQVDQYIDNYNYDPECGEFFNKTNEASRIVLKNTFEVI